MRILAPLAALVLLGACATESGGTPPAPPPGTPEAGCDVTVSFGSYAMGIDQEAFAKVDAWLSGHPDLVANVTTTAWGREGEKTVCVTTTSPAAIKPVFKGVLAQLPTVGKKAPITLLSREGGHFHTKGGPGT